MGLFHDEFYNEYLMGDFTGAFGKYQLISDDKGREIVLRDLIDGEDGEKLQKRNYRFFKETCEKLVEVGCYSWIVKFIDGVLRLGKAYNLTKIKEVLDNVRIHGDDTLGALCWDFYFLMKKKHSSLPRNIAMEIPPFIIKRILNIDMDPENISKEDVDNIVSEIIKINALEFEKEEENIKRINREREEEEKGLYNIRINRDVQRKITAFHRKMEVPGLLLDLFRAAELTIQDEICYYIETQYLWPIMKTVPWKQKSSTQVQFMGMLLGNYMDSIFSLETSRQDIYRMSNTSFNYSDGDFFQEMMSSEPGILSGPGMNLAKNHGELGSLMSETIASGKGIFKGAMAEYLYSFLMAFTPYLLYCSGNVEDAGLFLIRNYDEISFDEKRRLYLQLTMVKCILESNKLEEANVLYGYYNYEMDRQQREEKPIMIFIREVIQYIEDVRDYLEESNEYTYGSNKAWVDVVFGDGRITGDAALAEGYLVKGEIIPEELFKRLMLYVEAFCYPTGINLGVLGLPKEDNYDKLYDALSDELIKEGRGLKEKRDEYLTFYQSLNHLDIRENINIFLQRHISKLADEAIEYSMDKIKALRKSLSLPEKFIGDNGPDEEDEITDPKARKILKRIEEVSNELTAKLESQYIGRAEVELSIDRLQRDFIEKYNLVVARDNLIGLLPLREQKDCSIYLVTAEIVYRMLSKRNDAKELDFSPALITLTKAMELVLNLVFQKMPFGASDMDFGSRSYYFDRNNNKESIEFGPCINLLKDSSAIYVNNYNGRYKLSWADKKYYIPGVSRFEKLHGHRVINFDKLKAFEGLSILIEPGYKAPPVSVAFTGDKEHNRMLFIKGLEYVKNNYRNKVAHKEGVSQQKVDDCRRILLQTENLLWILLYIINNTTD